MNNSSKMPEQAIAPSVNFYTVTPGASELPSLPKGLWITSDGTLSIKSLSNITVTVTVVAGQIIPVRPSHVLAATTAGVVALA